MVFFTCDACGQSVKKNQVEKHYQTRCPQCNVLSCLDCGKEFHGDEYKSHIKCITEDEKYGSVENRAVAGKLSKGEVKQANWLQQVKLATKDANLSPRMTGLVQHVTEYSNIPRKKAKFKNFLKNSLRISDEKTCEELWQVFDSANNNPSQAQPTETAAAAKDEEDATTKEELPGQQNEAGEAKRRKKEKKAKEKSEVDVSDEKVDSLKLKKKKRKWQESCVNDDDDKSIENRQSQKQTKRKKKKCKIEDTDPVDLKKNSDLPNSDKPKKKRKKNVEIVNGEDQTDEECLIPGKRKLEGNKDNGKEIQQVNHIAEDEEDTTQETDDPPRKKFHWESTIESVLKSASENEMAIKKLRKKVVGEFWAQGGDSRLKTKEEVLSSFNHKIHKSKKFKVHKEKVRLVIS